MQHVADGNDLAAIDTAIGAARAARTQPSIILVRTVIGYGAPHKQNTFEAHGSPLGPDELRAAKDNLGWPREPAFLVPPEVEAHFRTAVARGQALERDWDARLRAYRAAHPDLAAELTRRLAGELPDGWDADLPGFAADAKGIATRKASESVMQALAARLPELVGGSADLNPSTFTWLKKEGDFEAATASQDGAQGQVGGPWGPIGRNLHFGVREHAMGSAVNGLALHGGFIPYGSTFLVFSDYMRPAIRLSALGHLGTIWVFTHDSIGVGEDGPTHQPVEHYAALRAIPDLLFIRPGDANETVWAWRLALEQRHRPTALALTRQNVPTLDRTRFASAEGTRRGAYVLNPDVGRSPGGADGHRVGGASDRRRRGPARTPWDQGTAGVHALLAALRRAVRRVSRRGAAPATRGPARGRGRRRPSGGTGGSVREAISSRSITSAPPRRRRSS